MAKEKEQSFASELLNKNHSAKATAEVRAQMADPGLMKSKGYVPPKNPVNPGAKELPEGISGS